MLIGKPGSAIPVGLDEGTFRREITGLSSPFLLALLPLDAEGERRMWVPELLAPDFQKFWHRRGGEAASPPAED